MNDVQIIKRESIPAIREVEEGGMLHRLGELRDFSWSEPLRNFMSGGSGFSASWVQLADQEVLHPHTHPVLSMMVFYAGAGQMIGDVTKALVGDEVVVVPPGCLHGFVGGPPGLYALSIQFAGGLYSTPEQPRVVFAKDEESLKQLVEFSERRAEAFAKKPIFEFIKGTQFTNAKKRRAFLDALRIWTNGTEALTVSRYASCNDPVYQSAFREHLFALADRDADQGSALSGPRPPRDAKLEALTSWFAYQMYVLDNAEKTAIVSLVVDQVNASLRRSLSPALGERQLKRTFGSQARDADARIARGVTLLNHATPSMYVRLRELVGEAWDMAEAMADRLTSVTLAASVT